MRPRGAVERGVADHRTVHHHAEHEVGPHALGDAGADVRPIRADEVRDHLAPRPVATEELIVREREHGRGGVFEAPVEAFVTEEPEKMEAEEVGRGRPQRHEARALDASRRGQPAQLRQRRKQVHELHQPR